jgi:hypothetical protein
LLAAASLRNYFSRPIVSDPHSRARESFRGGLASRIGAGMRLRLATRFPHRGNHARKARLDATLLARIRALREARNSHLLASGAMSLTSVCMLRPHLTPENHGAVLARACGRSRREIEALVAELAPRPDVPSSVRKLPMATAAPTLMPAATPPAARVEAATLASPEPAPTVSSPPRSRGHVLSAPGRIGSGISRAMSSARSRNVMAANAPSSPRADTDARSARSWSSITSCPTRWEDWPRSRTSRFVVAATTNMRPN